MQTMKIRTFTWAIGMATICLFSCHSGSQGVAMTEHVMIGGMANGGEVEKTLEVVRFSGIESRLAVDIHYTQGAEYNVKVRASQDVMDRSSIFVSGSILILKMKKDAEDDDRDTRDKKLTLFVTAPKINSLENSGSMKFKTMQMGNGGLHIVNKGQLDVCVQKIVGKSGNGLSIDNTGRMTVEVPEVDMTKVSLENKGVLTFTHNGLKSEKMTIDNFGKITFSGKVTSQTVDLNNAGVCHVTSAFNLTDSYTFNNSGRFDMIGDVSGKEACLKNLGVCRMESSFDVTGSYSYSNSGRSEGHGDVVARTINIFNSGIDKKEGKLNADGLTMKISGKSHYDMDYAGGDVTLDCKGVGHFNLGLDCRSIKVNSSGRINVTLSGTADNTLLEGSGVSHVNTSKLNKF